MALAIRPWLVQVVDRAKGMSAYKEKTNESNHDDACNSTDAGTIC